MADIKDLLGSAIDKDAVQFTDTFNELMKEKIADAIDLKRIDFASSMFEEEVEQVEETEEVEDSE